MFSTNFSGRSWLRAISSPLSGCGIVVGGQHQHRADGVVGLGGELHTRHCRTPAGCLQAASAMACALASNRAAPWRSDVNSGLEGVVATETTIALVDGQAGRLLYRGYEIGDLAAHGSYDRVVGLLLDGEWPSATRCCRPVEPDSRRCWVRCARCPPRAPRWTRCAPAFSAFGAERRMDWPPTRRPGPRADRAGPRRGRRLRAAARRQGAGRRRRAAPTWASPAGCCTRSRASSPTPPGRGRWTPTSRSAPSTA